MNKIDYESLKNGEIRIASRNGSYLYTSDTFCNTKKHHGLFVTRIPEKEKVYHILLSSLDETLNVNNCEYQLAHHNYFGSQYPDGDKYISYREKSPVFTTYYCMGPFSLKKEIMLSDNIHAIYIRYTLLESVDLTRITLSPFLAFRSIFSLSSQNILANTSITKITNGISSKMYEYLPPFYMQISNENNFKYEPLWNNNFEYNGKTCNLYEDLFTPGYFEFYLKQGQSCIFTASLEKISNFDIIRKLFDTKKNKEKTYSENEKVNTKKQILQYA
jgi:predicted glycogen debranching enzyme